MFDRTTRQATRRAVLAIALLLALSAMLFSGPSHRAGLAADEPEPALVPPIAVNDPARPNVVLIVTDDQRAGTLDAMPNVTRLLRQPGTTYSKAMVPTSLCCPSRATILTGRYAHSSRMYGNGDIGGRRYGGWSRFHELGLENITLAPALRNRGYRTALVGKYLNFFGQNAPAGYVPPGWDYFSAMMSNHGAYYNYRLSDGGFYGSQPQDYSTDVLAARATDFIATTPADQPLFLYFAPYGPHAPYTPAPRHLGALDGTLEPWRAPSANQRLASMPRFMRERRHFSQAEVDLTRQRQLEALMSVDEAVGAIGTTLAAAGRDRDTLFVFMSDNGYFWGEHRAIGKDAPYDAATSIPLVLRWDGHVASGATSNKLVLNVDVARTIAKATGAAMRTDGLDILGPRARKGFVLEAMRGYNGRPSYCGYRTRNRMFVRWSTGERELYDYRLDAGEQRNLAERPRWAVVRKAMRNQAVATCRPRPPGYRW